MVALLDGVVVLDLSRILAGPWATQIFGDMGASVIKVEKPGAGDDTRQWGPPFVTSETGEDGDAAYFLCANRNKKSVTIDFTAPEGAALVQKLAERADILVENYKVGGLRKYGLDYDAIHKINPKLVYCSITGFGQDGPYAEQAGYDFAIQAMGGLMSITGQPDGVDGGGPMKTGVAVADLFSGMYAATAVLAALRHAERTGEGQHLDVSLFDCQVAMLANQAMNFLITGEAPKRFGNAHPNIVPYAVFMTGDDPIVIAVGNDDQFVRLCQILGVEDAAEQPDFSTNKARVANRQALTTLINNRLSEKSAREWLAECRKVNIPAAPINTLNQVFEDPHLKARALTASFAEGGRAYVRHPVKYSSAASAGDTPPPRLSEHTDEILRAYGTISEEAIRELRARKII